MGILGEPRFDFDLKYLVNIEHCKEVNNDIS